MRTLPALIVTAALLATLSACSTGTASVAADCVQSGSSSSTVTATSDEDAAPEVSFPTPLVPSDVEKTVLREGTGEPLKAGQPTLIQATILQGSDAASVQTTDYTGLGSLFTVGEDTIPGLGEALACSTEGSRIAVTTPAADGAPALVFVVDVIEAYPAKADGRGQVPQNGSPAVVTTPDGTPGITVPNTEAPTELVVNVLEQGEGATVEEGDQLIVKYTGVLWSDSSVFDSTWEAGGAAVLDMTDGATIPGFHDALVGQQIGSQVLSVVPPADGYGDTAQGSIPAGSTLVFVVDILGVVGQ